MYSHCAANSHSLSPFTEVNPSVIIYLSSDSILGMKGLKHRWANVCVCRYWCGVEAGLNRKWPRGVRGADQTGGGSLSLIFRDCGRAGSRCNKRSALENNRSAAILAHWLVCSPSVLKVHGLITLDTSGSKDSNCPRQCATDYNSLSNNIALEKKKKECY